MSKEVGLGRYQSGKRSRGKCGVEGCHKGVWARGLCGAHYQRLIRTGELRAEDPVGAGLAIANPKLDEKQVIEIRRSSASCHALADRFGVAKSVVYRARIGKTWGHIDLPAQPWDDRPPGRPPTRALNGARGGK